MQGTVIVDLALGAEMWKSNDAGHTQLRIVMNAA